MNLTPKQRWQMISDIAGCTITLTLAYLAYHVIKAYILAH